MPPTAALLHALSAVPSLLPPQVLILLRKKKKHLGPALSSWWHRAALLEWDFPLPGLEAGGASGACRSAAQQDQLSLLWGQNPGHGAPPGFGLGTGLRRPGRSQRLGTGRSPHSPETCPAKGTEGWVTQQTNIVMYQH